MTTIRNYQGEVPEGVWYCQDCPFESILMEDAASHVDGKGHWVWLFDKGAKYSDWALFEIHNSDSVDGVYLNSCYKGQRTLGMIYGRRPRMVE